MKPLSRFYLTTFVLAAIAGIFVACGSSNESSTKSSSSTTAQTAASAATPVDIHKLPLGDKKYKTTPTKDYVYVCNTNFNGGGAFTNGPWIDEQNKTWDLSEKVQV